MPKWKRLLHKPLWLDIQYQTKTCAQIAKEVGCSVSGVRAALNKFEIARRHTGRPRADTRIFDDEWLKTEYLTKTTRQIASGLGCAQITVWRRLKKIGVEMRQPYSGQVEFPKCGYRQRKYNGRTSLEHRQIMETHLGRPLESWEHVHHIDGDKLNNSLDNLIVLTSTEHGRLHAAKKNKR